MLERFLALRIAGGACLAAAGLRAVEPRTVGPTGPMTAAAALAHAGLGLIFVGASSS